MQATWPSGPIASNALPDGTPILESPRAAGTERPFVFTATGPGYFRIWIVNLLLTLLTIGIYSPWAKVRRLRYFYGNTLFDGSPFEFHGRPLALFKGRLVGLVLLVAYSQAAKISLTLWVVVVVALMGLLPWLLWKSLRFRFANSSYRGIRFAFEGTVGQAYLTFVPLILMVLAPTFVALLAQGTLDAADPTSLRTLGRYYAAIGLASLFVPWFYFRLRAYQHRNGRLGATPFGFDARLRSAYWLAFKILLLMLGFGLVATLVAGVVFGGWAFLARGHAGPGFDVWMGAVVAGVAYLLVLSGLSQPMAMVQNFVWNHSTLDGARFASRVGRGRLWWILFGNLVLIVLTAGLFWPFAAVRLARYRIGSLSWDGEPGALIAGDAVPGIAATGEETAELFGLDIAL